MTVQPESRGSYLVQSPTQPLIPSLLRQVGSLGKVTTVPKTTVLMSRISPGSDSSKAGLAWGGNGHAFFAPLLLLLPQDLREEGSTSFATKSLCTPFLQEYGQLLCSQVLVG